MRGRRELEDFGPGLIGDVLVISIFLPAARVPVAAEVDVAGILDEGDVQGAQGVDVGVQGGVGVPGREETRAVGVEEGQDVRQRGVVVDDVRQVGHGLVALVGRGGATGR